MAASPTLPSGVARDSGVSEGGGGCSSGKMQLAGRWDGIAKLHRDPEDGCRVRQ